MKKLAIVFLILFFMEGGLSQGIVTYTSKLNETLPCVYPGGTSTITWTDVTDGGSQALFQYIPAIPQVDDNRADTKHDNFNYIITPTSFNLLIEDVDKDDGGTYRCVLSGVVAEPIDTTLNVEVLPDQPLSLTCNPASTNCSLPSEDVSGVKCTCEATGVRPNTLQLQWTAGAPVTVTRNVSSTEGDDLTNLSTDALVKPTSIDNILVCTLIGYTAIGIPEISSAITFAPPSCNLSITVINCEASLDCQCNEGFPEATIQYFFDNNTMIDDPTRVSIPEDVNTTFHCRGCNGVNYGSSSVATNTTTCEIGTTVSSTTTPDKTPPTEVYASTLDVNGTELVTGTTVPPPIPTDDNNKPATKGLSGGVIAAIIIVSIAALIGVGVLIYCCCFRNGASVAKTNSNDKPDSGNGAEPEIPAYGVINKTKSSRPSPSPAPRNIPSEKDEKRNVGSPNERMQLQYAELDHGKNTSTVKVHQPQDEPTEYATVQSVIV